MSDNTKEQCRACLIKQNDMVTLAADHVVCNKVISVLNLLKLCSDLKIDLNDGYPQFVCADCVHSAEKSYEFRLQCIQSDETLHLTPQIESKIKLETVEIIEEQEEPKNTQEDDDYEIEYVFEPDDDDEEEEEEDEVEKSEKTNEEDKNRDEFPEENEEEFLDEDMLEEEVQEDENEEEFLEFVSDEVNKNTVLISDDEMDGEIEYLDDPVDVDPIDTGEKYECDMCLMKFKAKGLLDSHKQTHLVEFYQCQYCPVKFISQELLDKHTVKHFTPKTTSSARKPSLASRSKPKLQQTPDSPILYKCLICAQTHKTFELLKKHSASHNKKQPSVTYSRIKCSVCKTVFQTRPDFEKHKKSNTCIDSTVSNQRYYCTYCFKLFQKEEALAEHLKTHPESARKSKLKLGIRGALTYKCKLCPKTEDVLSLIKEHLATHQIESKEIFQNLLYKCTECNEEKESIYEYFQHSHTHNYEKIEEGENGQIRIRRNRPYKCSEEMCGKAFPTPSALRAHSQTHRSHWPKKCQHCEAVLDKWYDYVKHMSTNHDDLKQVNCTVCSKKFFNDRNLRTHMATHTGERNYICDFCGIGFQARHNLISHRRIHTGDKPYQCKFCPLAFTQYSGLRSHELNHTGVKNYECQTCHKKFLRAGSLRNHVKIHLGLKEFPCHICGVKFRASSTRNKHILTHTGERNHICEFCSKAFSRRSNLIVHRKIHTGETPHVCQVCGKGFIQLHVLRSHMNTHKNDPRSRKQPIRNTAVNLVAESVLESQEDDAMEQTTPEPEIETTEKSSS